MGNHGPSRAKRDGYAAFGFKTLDENPYKHPYLGDSWVEGWREAERDAAKREQERSREEAVDAVRAQLVNTLTEALNAAPVDAFSWASDVVNRLEEWLDARELEREDRT